RPLTARVGEKRVAHRVERALRRHGRLDVRAAEDRDRHGASRAQTVFTAWISFPTESFASPNSIAVFGFRYSSLSMPAKPGRIERLSTTTCWAWSTLRIGMP